MDMRERKYVKFRIDMYEDTKLKIIDMNPERDLIHYIWNRVVILAGKVNLDGELHMSKNIPYTAETLAIEFNRSVDKVLLALKIFIELEMIEFIQDNIYRVKNFVKHQNIKIKEKSKFESKEENKILKDNSLKSKINQIRKNIDKDKHGNKNVTFANEITQEAKEEQNKLNYVDSTDSNYNDEIHELKIINKDITKVSTSHTKNESINKNSKDNGTISLEKSNNKKASKKKKRDININVSDGEAEDSGILCFYDGDISLNDGESVIEAWAF